MGLLSTITADRWIALGSSAGTLVAAILAAVNIREIRLQRSQQFKPRIAPSSAMYGGVIDPKHILAFDAGRTRLVTILNLGNGVATNLRVKWSAPIEEWVTMVNTLSAQRGVGIGVETDEFGLHFRFHGAHVGAVRLPDAIDSDTQYVLPVSAGRTPSTIQIPGGIAALIDAYYWSYFSSIGGEHGGVINPDAVFHFTASISYEDTLARRVTRKTVFQISALCEQSNQGKDAPLTVQYSVEPVVTEPAEGFSTINKVAFAIIRESFRAASGFSIRI